MPRSAKSRVAARIGGSKLQTDLSWTGAYESTRARLELVAIGDARVHSQPGDSVFRHEWRSLEDFDRAKRADKRGLITSGADVHLGAVASQELLLGGTTTSGRLVA